MSKNDGESGKNEMHSIKAQDVTAIMKRVPSRKELERDVYHQVGSCYQQSSSTQYDQSVNKPNNFVSLINAQTASGSRGGIRGWIKEAIKSKDRVIRVAGVALKNAFTEAVDTIWKGKKKHNDVPRPYESREDGLESIVYNALAKLYNVFARFIEVAGSALGIERARDVAEKITNKAKKFEEIADRVYTKKKEKEKGKDNKFAVNDERSNEKNIKNRGGRTAW